MKIVISHSTSNNKLDSCCSRVFSLLSLTLNTCTTWTAGTLSRHIADIFLQIRKVYCTAKTLLSDVLLLALLSGLALFQHYKYFFPHTHTHICLAILVRTLYYIFYHFASLVSFSSFVVLRILLTASLLDPPPLNNLFD